MRIDLHTHSSVSDGTDTPAELVAAAAAAGTPGLAGIPWVARPEPASARRPSTWP